MYFCYMQNQKTVLWLSGWLPSSTLPDAGNFIVRHANAFARFQRKQNQSIGLVLAHFPVFSLWDLLRKGSAVAVPKPSLDLIDEVNLIWHPVMQFGDNSVAKFFNYLYYKYSVAKKLRSFFSGSGIQVAGVHVHAADKIMRVVPGFLDWGSRELGKELPLWYTEHWAIFNDVVFDGFGKRNQVFQRDMVGLWTQVTVAAPVSLSVHSQMQRQLGGAKPYVHYRNVVDTQVFHLLKIEKLESAPFVFLHVSSMEPRKNVPGLLRAFAELKRKYPSRYIQLKLVGGGNEQYLSEAKTVVVALGLLFSESPSVLFMGSLVSTAVAKEMQSADAFVLFSEMENAPCVISESLCCGLPVLSTDVAGIPEMIDISNGILVKPKDEGALMLAMESMLNRREKWNRTDIAVKAHALYGEDAVSAVLSESYRNVLEPCVA